MRGQSIVESGRELRDGSGFSELRMGLAHSLLHRVMSLMAAHPGNAIRAPHQLSNGVFAVNLLAIICGGLQKAALECSVEAGRVLVSNGMRNFLNAQVAVCEKICGPLESLFA
jgi:hypothetical protein